MAIPKSAIAAAVVAVALYWVQLKEFAVPPAGGAILVTGASSGIGKHAALALDALGYIVYAGVRKQADADVLTAERGSLRPVLVDVAHHDEVTAAAATIAADAKAEGFQVVGLVNNAGISHRLPLELEDMARVRQMYDVNVFGLIQTTQAFIPLLRAGGVGRIVNVGSIAGLMPHRGATTYGGTKGAVELITDSLRLELAPWDISVSLIEPGYVKTAIAGKQTGDKAVHHRADPKKAELYRAWIDAQSAKRQEAEKYAASVDVTTDAIVHALTDAYPSTRYVVATAGKGVPAKVVTTLKWLLPDRLYDIPAGNF
jgi:short-subunit dehydrogenase